MPRVKLTAQGMKGLGPGEWWDILLPGFGVRVLESGRATYFVRYRLRGKNRRMGIGYHPVTDLKDARDKARRVLEAVGEGRDPAMEARPETVAYLIDLFIERYAKVNKKSWAHDRYMLDKYVRPALGSLRVQDVRRRDVLGLFDDLIAAGAPGVANTIHSMLRKMFRWAMERELAETSPMEGVSRPAKQRSRSRFLSEEEIRTLLRALDVEFNPSTASIFRLALLTGQRKGEILGMRHSQILGRWWTIPGETTKNRLTHRVYLSDQAQEAIADAQHKAESDLVLVSPQTGSAYHPHSVILFASRLSERCGFKFTIHDLRRTMATHMTTMGIPRLVVSKCLNHFDSSVTGIYDRASYDEAKQDAWTRWGQRVAALAADQSTPATRQALPGSNA